MARLRAPEPPPASPRRPARLERFEVADWLEEVGPVPGWWDDPPEAWAPFKARLLHMRALRAWKAEQAI